VEAPLEGVVAVVTGGSRGIGKGIALELGAAGATVYVTGRTVLPGDHPLPGTIGDTAAAVTELRGHGVAVGCDHHVDGEVEAVFDRVMSEAGRLDLLVNNAVSSPTVIPWLGRPFWELPVAAWDETIDIGCRSHYVAARFAAPLLLANGRGLIVNVSSWAGRFVGSVTGPAYHAAKFGVNAMTETINIEEGLHGIRATAVCPGEVATPILDKRPIPVTPEQRALLVQPEDCGELMLFLARMPAHVCINEVIISPTHNRGYVAAAKAIPD